jgi:hypothetical protein
MESGYGHKYYGPPHQMPRRTPLKWGVYPDDGFYYRKALRYRHPVLYPIALITFLGLCVGGILKVAGVI